MHAIQREHLVQSVADALQFISYYHPADYIRALGRAYEREQSPAAKDAIAQILTNSRLCAEGHRPICQDTGFTIVVLDIGQDVHLTGGKLDDAINEGVRRGYLNPDNPLRASVLEDPQFARRSTKDNTPAVIHMTVVPGATLDVTVAAVMNTIGAWVTEYLPEQQRLRAYAFWLNGGFAAATPAESSEPVANTDRVLTARELEDLERKNVQRAPACCGGKVSGEAGAARLLGIPPTTLSSRMKALGIQRKG